MIRLLLVEDNEPLCYVIQDGLQLLVEGYEVIIAHNGREGINIWREYSPDIILVDVDMPEMNGFEMVEYIRERDKEIPVLFISGCTSSTDVATGYKVGANNYIKKPFNVEELDAHVKGLIKNMGDTRERNKHKLQRCGDFIFNPTHGVLYFGTSTTPIELTGLEAEVLSTLILYKGEVVKRSFLLEKHWETKDGQNTFYPSRSLDVIVSKLRKKLEEDPTVKIITTKGVGVMLTDLPIDQD